MPTHNRVDSSFVDRDGITIFYSKWVCKNPIAVVQISHGQGDHRLRYESLATEMVEKGFNVYADDHRGHGDTWHGQWGSDPAKFGRPGPRGVNGMVDSIAAFTELIRKENPGLPLVFLGHSMGSLLGQMSLDKGQLRAEYVVWSGTAYRTLFGMNAGDLNSKHRSEDGSGHEWLNRDEKAQRDFRDDPKTFVAKAMRQFGIFGSLRLLGTPRKAKLDIPILILQGGDDALGNEKSVLKLANRYVASGFSDVSLIVYPDARHEVYNETNAKQVRGDLFEWLNERLKEKR